MNERREIQLIKEMIAHMRPPQEELDLQRDRARYDSAALAFGSYVKTTVCAVDLNGVACEVHAPPQGSPAGCMVYFHGGGYVLGSAKSHRHLAAELSRRCGCLVVVPDYALSPECPFPAALEDAVAVFGAAAQRWPDLPIVLAGDSAGGGLAVSTARQVRRTHAGRVGAIVCLSPWMDLTCASRLFAADATHDQSLDSRRLRIYANQYLGGCAPDHPLASPLFAPLDGLPPILVQVGCDEILYADAVSFVERVERAGGEVQLDVWDNVVHVWQWYWPVLKVGSAAIAGIASFLQSKLRAASAPQDCSVAQLE